MSWHVATWCHNKKNKQIKIISHCQVAPSEPAVLGSFPPNSMRQLWSGCSLQQLTYLTRSAFAILTTPVSFSIAAISRLPHLVPILLSGAIRASQMGISLQSSKICFGSVENQRIRNRELAVNLMYCNEWFFNVI